MGSQGATGPGLIQSFPVSNASVITLNTGNQTILQQTGVVVGAGQKVIVHWSINFGALGSGNVVIYTNFYVGANPIDATQDIWPSNSILGIGAGPSFHTLTRSFEFVPGAGTYTFALVASAAAGPSITIDNASPPYQPAGQMIIQVVSN
jgi:hypothetical protein